MYNLNKVITTLKQDISLAVAKLMQESNVDKTCKMPEVLIEIPADTAHGNLSSNIAMVSARLFKLPPRKIAEMIVSNLSISGDSIAKTEIAGPGFINFFFNDKFFADTVKEVVEKGEHYGSSEYGQGKKVMVEFVSANPTGPMHLGNARGGALGDCLSAVLKKAGYDVHKEFYVNDAGNQIEKFGLSLSVRYQQICKGEDYIAMPETCYQGQDIIDLAKEFFEINGDKYIDADESVRKKALVDFALPKNIARMKLDMGKYKIFYDKWFYESELHKSGEVDRIIELLGENGYTYRKDGCVWYKATDFGSEKDEVLRRSNGIPTYYAADIAYHYNKFVTRGFDICIDVLGADHHGHVERMKDAMEALGIERNRLNVLLFQLVRLTKGGEIIRMSKRTGKAIQLSDLIDEVGADSAKFIFNNSQPNLGMDFDLDLAVKQDSQNPVYYVKYAYARICSVFRQLNEEQLNCYKSSEKSFDLLNSEPEKNLIYYMATFPDEILRSAQEYDPTRITRYVINLATMFHKFYSGCKIMNPDINLMNARLDLCLAVKMIIKSILDMFQIEAPEVME